MENNYTIDNTGKIMCNDVVVIMEENDPTYISYLEFLSNGGTVNQINEPIVIEEFTGVKSAKKN